MVGRCGFTGRGSGSRSPRRLTTGSKAKRRPPHSLVWVLDINYSLTRPPVLLTFPPLPPPPLTLILSSLSPHFPTVVSSSPHLAPASLHSPQLKVCCPSSHLSFPSTTFIPGHPFFPPPDLPFPLTLTLSFFSI